jgi:hypothetical protein
MCLALYSSVIDLIGKTCNGIKMLLLSFLQQLIQLADGKPPLFFILIQ